MTAKTAGLVVVATGLITFLSFIANLGALASVMAGLQLLFLVGSPLALTLKPELKSWASVGVVAVALSISLTALAVQSLIWFSVASPPVIVATATAYSAALSWALTTADLGRVAEAERV